MTWGDGITLVGAAITLVGAVRSLAPLGGWRAAFPEQVHRAARAVRAAPRRWWRKLRGRRDGTVAGTIAFESGAAVSGTVTVTASGILIPNPVADTDRFITELAAQLGELQAADAATRRDLAGERADREAAVQAARDAAAAAVAAAVADTKRVELSGVRTQLVGVAFVVAGFAADAVTGG